LRTLDCLFGSLEALDGQLFHDGTIVGTLRFMHWGIEIWERVQLQGRSRQQLRQARDAKFLS
jgi:hypothetical protein